MTVNLKKKSIGCCHHLIVVLLIWQHESVRKGRKCAISTIELD